MLKKILYIFFLFTYLISTTELHEIFKIPFLAEHYLEHKKELNSLSFDEFIVEHYIASKNKDENHSSLPFKSHPELLYSIAIIAIVPTPLSSLLHTCNIDKQDEIVSDELIFSQGYHLTIWQPPRLC